MFLRPNISRTFFEDLEKVGMIIVFFFKQLSYRHLILLNSITLKSNLIVSGIQWLISVHSAVKLFFTLSLACLSRNLAFLYKFS